jgi:hypothetical protein
MPQTLDAEQGLVVLPERRVRITGPVRVPVVAPVIGDPADDRTLERHRAEDRE